MLVSLRPLRFAFVVRLHSGRQHPATSTSTQLPAGGQNLKIFFSAFPIFDPSPTTNGSASGIS